MARTQVLLLLALTLVLVASSPYKYASASPDLGIPVLGIWSLQHGTNNITDTSLGIGSQLIIIINITNAPSFNSYDFSLYFDSRFINATDPQIDMETNVMFGQAFVVAKNIIPPGRIRLAAVDLSGSKQGNGTLVRITFTVRGIGVSPLIFAAASTRQSSGAQSYTRITLGNQPLELTTSDGYFRNDAVKLGPVAIFTHSSDLREGVPIRFNATDSFDPDNLLAENRGISSYIWDFGDGTSTPAPAIVNHTFATGIGAFFTGNFSVLLIVTDSVGFQGMKTLRVEIAPAPLHDVSVSIQAQPELVDKGKNISVTVTVRNAGTFVETFSLAVIYGPPTTSLHSVTGVNITVADSETYSLTIRTSDLAPSTYTINATVTTVVQDERLGNNQAFAIVTVRETSSSPILYVVAGIVAVVAAGATIGTFLRRRRKPET